MILKRKIMSVALFALVAITAIVLAFAFTERPTADAYLDVECAPNEHNFVDDVCTVCGVPAIAKIEDRYFATVSDAFSAANEAETATVTLIADADVFLTLSVDAGKNITLDLNGYKITYKDDTGSVIIVEGSFTLEDGNATATNQITDPISNSIVEVQGGVITGGKGDGSSKIGGGIYVKEGGAFTMNGGNVSGNVANYGGGVRIGSYTGATFTMTSGSISYNKATDCGGGVYLSESQMTLSGNAEISHNKTSRNGGGVHIENSSTLLMGGGKICNNIADDDYNQGNGGGVNLASGTFTMNAGEISDNLACVGGGVSYFGGINYDLKMKLSGGLIARNTAISIGAGIMLHPHPNYVLEISGAPKVINNATTTGIKNNVHLHYDATTGYATVDLVGILQEGANIGFYVYHDDVGVTANGFSLYKTQNVNVGIVSDRSKRCFIEKDGGLQLQAHNLLTVGASAPTCTQAGWEEYQSCSRCSYSTKTEIPATGHTFGDWVDEIPATATQNGVKAHKDCNVCNRHFDNVGQEIADLSIPASGVIVSVSGGVLDGLDVNTATVNKNGSVTVIAATQQGRTFKGWSIDGGATIISDEARYTFTATQNVTLVAVYEDVAESGLSGGAIAGIVIGCLAIILLTAYIVCYFVLYRKGVLNGKAFDIIFAPMNAIFNKKKQDK